MTKVLHGIQQVGIGVANVYEAWRWYRQHFGMDIRIFDEAAVAGLMLPHTGGEPRKRHAVLAMNLQSGGGFEIWQYSERTPEAPKFEVMLGDLGIFIVKIKCKDVRRAYQSFKEKGLNVLGNPMTDPVDQESFFMKDPYGNIFQLISDEYWLKDERKLTGAVCGVTIGVSDIQKALPVYSEILGYGAVVYDTEGQFDDLSCLPGGSQNYRRVLLKQEKEFTGGFAPLLGPGQIELIQSLDRSGRSIFEDRLWGDLGFIHLCLDIQGMSSLRTECEEKGFPFTVDSSQSFDMGEAAGHFSYIADPDGTLIEFVETHKVPILKKIGWYINLQKRDPHKSLPTWLIKAMSFNRYKGE